MALHITPDSYTKLLIHSDTTNGSTSIVDSSPSGHTITINGTVTHSTGAAKFGSTAIYSANDSSAYLSLPDSTDFDFGTGTDFTIDYWMYHSGTIASWDCMFELGRISGGGEDGVGNYLNTNGSIRTHYAINAYDSAAGVITTNKWYHIAVVRNGSAWNTYVNGVSVGSVTSATAINQGSDAFRIQNAVHTTSYPWAGYIDEFRVSSIARWTDSFVPPNKPYSVVDDDFVTDVAGIEDESSVTTVGKDFVVKSDPSEASTDSVFSVNAKDGTELLDVRADGTINGVKIYRGLITQEMTEEPEVVVLENTIGTIVWTRYAEGEFRGTLSGAFPQEKTWLTMGSEFELVSADLVIGVFRRRDDNTVGIRIVDYEGNLLDGEMGRNPIEIRIYP